jgi:hypothetical protein
MAVLAVILAFETPVAGQREQEWMADKNYLIVPVEGAELFREYCAACHGRDATGNGPAALALRRTPPDLTRISERNGGRFPRERVREYISGEASLLSHGSREMPIWGPIFRQADRDYELGEIRLHNVTIYLESLQKTPVESLRQK